MPSEVATARTRQPTGVAAPWLTLTETPTDSSPSFRRGLISLAAAISMRAIIREVANTAGKASSSERQSASAVSSSSTVRLASADCPVRSIVISCGRAARVGE